MQGRTVLVAGSLAAAVVGGWSAARYLPFPDEPADDVTRLREPVRFTDAAPATPRPSPHAAGQPAHAASTDEQVDPEMAEFARLLGAPVQHYASPQEAVRWRPPVYKASGFGDPSHPYPHASSATLRALADAGDGAAAWHLAIRQAARDNTRVARDFALKAAVLLDSGEPIILLVENYLADTRNIGEAWAYLLIAKEIGVEPVQRIDKWIAMASEEELANSQAALEALRIQAESFRAPRRRD